MDAMGLRPAIDELAAHLCAKGYVVLVPNVAYRAGKVAPFDAKTVWGDEPERKRLQSVLATVHPEGTLRDIGLYLEALEVDAAVKPGPVGAFGYCMGGVLAIRTAAAFPSRVAAAASIHGGNLVNDKPNSPHLLAPKIKARVYFGCADNDRSCTAEDRAALEESFARAGSRHQIELYTGKSHGFAVPDTSAFDVAACEQHWQRIEALFKAEL
jgi:carboxymethylenebutenolidase